METALEYGIDKKLSELINNFKISNVENLIMSMTCEASKSTALHYIGEQNKTDVML